MNTQKISSTGAGGGGGAVAIAVVAILNHTLLAEKPLDTDTSLAIVGAVGALSAFVLRWLRWKGWIPPTVILLIAMQSQACATFGASDQRAALVGLSASIGSTAGVLADVCGNAVPGGPCLEDSYVSTDLRDSVARQLQRALDVVRVARAAVNIGESGEVGAAIEEAARILDVVRRALMREQLAAQGGAS